MDVTNYSPLVSAVIPTYNRAHFITLAVDSVLNQTYENYEVVVVNDGSKDNTEEVLSRYKDHPKVRIITKKNGGLSAARNTGIEAAKGELIAFLDDDDAWRPHKLAVQVPLFADPNVNLVHTAGHFYDESNGWTNTQFFGDIDFHEQLAMRVIYVQTVITRKSVLEEVGPFDVDLPAGEDVDMWLRIGAKYRMTGIDNCTADIRCLADSMQRSNLENYFVYLNRILEKHSHYHGDCALCREALAKSRRQLRMHYFGESKKRGQAAWAAKKYGEALKLRLWAYRYDPMAIPMLPVNGVRTLCRKLAAK